MLAEILHVQYILLPRDAGFLVFWRAAARSRYKRDGISISF
jgi:hypothetical protein